MGSALLILGLALQFFGHPTGPTIRGIPYLLFVWIAMAVGLLCVAAGFYYLLARRRR